MGTVIGVFKGFIESGLEFKADLVVPYQSEFAPLLGSFLVVEVSKQRYLLGRITRFHPVGLMAGAEAEDYLARMSKAGRSVPEDLKEAKLRYNVNVKLLGALTLDGKGVPKYEPSMRQLPHLGARVGVPAEDALRLICSLGIEAGEKPMVLGRLAFGNVVFDGDGQANLPVPFDVRRLVGRRSYVFAHAGYGKTNLVKLLVTKLYETDPEVGFLIFDPEGEYAVTDKRGRPGLADVPELQDKVVLYTDRKLSPKYQRFLAGDVHLNLGSLRPGNVVKNCVPPEKWEQVWANAVRGLQEHEWAALVRLLEIDGYRADSAGIRDIVQNVAETTPPAIVNNIVPVVKRLHDKASRMLDGIFWHLERNHIIVVDISLMASVHGRWIASLILNEIFQRNQANFTAGAQRELLNVVTVVEEAQTVLSTDREKGETIFVEWAKEGRKYGLGSIFVTQQPGAIPSELVSQGDNFFVFHLLSTDDLASLQRANAHFSSDVLGMILNEPIPGNAYVWSAPYQPFVLSVRMENFEDYAKGAMRTKPAEALATPAEEFAKRIPDLQMELDRTVRELLEKDRQVPVYVNLVSNGQPLAGQVAVKLWNLKLGVGKSLSQEAARVFATEMPDGHKVVPDDTLLAALDRLTVRHRIMRSEKTPYLLLGSDALKFQKPTRSEVVDLQ
ncbi:MAG TPA: ATP-binding protein [Thermoplasmata archaeon]